MLVAALSPVNHEGLESKIHKNWQNLCVCVSITVQTVSHMRKIAIMTSSPKMYCQSFRLSPSQIRWNLSTGIFKDWDRTLHATLKFPTPSFTESMRIQWYLSSAQLSLSWLNPAVNTLGCFHFHYQAECCDLCRPPPLPHPTQSPGLNSLLFSLKSLSVCVWISLPLSICLWDPVDHIHLYISV